VILALLLAGVAWATDVFDPTTPDVVFTGPETYTQDETVKLWGAIERWSDPDETLFSQESFNTGLAWVNADYAPWIAACFGTSTPHSGTFLLHQGPNSAVARGTPILMVPGAGDNGSRGFIGMATRFDRSWRPVYALTFAHPHGDVFQQAEVVADAIAVVREHTGAAQVDVVAHSKGALAIATYASNTAGAEWGNPAYEAKGTAYGEDVRRMVLVAAPLGGVDTMYRWPAGNLLALDADAAISPASWRTWYPYGTGNLLVTEDLTAQDHLPGGADDLFPGQRQVLRRQPYDLPGASPWLMGYALQPDWYTSYEGGLGFQSMSDGIDAAIAAGGEFLDQLQARGVDADIEIYLLAGRNPIMPNGDSAASDALSGVATASEWGVLIASIDEHGIEVSASTDELQGLEDGQVVLGEVSGPSDGLVFVSSGTHAATLTGRGAVVGETRVVNLSHLDMLYASPVTGALLIDAADDAPENGWMRSFGERYTAEDTLGWIESILADDPEDPGDDTGLPDDDTGTDPPTVVAGRCGCAPISGTAAWPWLFTLAVLWRRRAPPRAPAPPRRCRSTRVGDTSGGPRARNAP
jgi:uncharacterized protein (TIGR03382 family)